MDAAGNHSTLLVGLEVDVEHKTVSLISEELVPASAASLDRELGLSSGELATTSSPAMAAGCASACNLGLEPETEKRATLVALA